MAFEAPLIQSLSTFLDGGITVNGGCGECGTGNNNVCERAGSGTTNACYNSGSGSYNPCSQSGP